MRSRRFLSVMALVSTLAAGAAQSGAQPAKAPGTEVLKQVLDKRLQSLRPEGTSERNVLFQTVLAGKPDGGSFPFRVTLQIRDYGAGYPANRYYGETCVSHITEWEYTLSPDRFGGWQVEGRMTPDSQQRTCKPNPSAGVSSIPLAGLAGSPAPAGPIAAQAAATGARNGTNSAAGSVSVGAYECWGNGEARPLLNFTIRDASHYAGTDGKAGTFVFDAATTRITFKGGSLDGVLPTGFFTTYHLAQGRPTVSFMSPSGNEAQFCEKH